MYFQRLYKFCHTKSKTTFQLRSSLLFTEAHFKINIKTFNTKLIFHKKTSILCFDIQHVFCNRHFHLSNQNNALPPNISAIIRTLLQFGAKFMVQNFKIWWENLPENKRALVLNQIKKQRINILAGCVLSTGFVYMFYVTHIVEDPITKRKKFLIFSDTEMVEMAKNEWKFIMENYKGQIIKSGYQYDKVMHISQQILNANSHLPKTMKNWQVIIVNDIKIKNAFVLPSGHIFIFTGMLEAVSNEDQLAAVIAHEISHVLLSHSAEKISKFYLLEMVMVLPFLALCELFPGSEAITYRITKYISYLLFHLPFSRSLEAEADSLGLQMMSRACYDPKQASLFWKKLEKIEKNKQVEWLSTHPSHQKRYKMLDEHMNEAIKIFEGHCRDKDMNPNLHK